MQNNIWEPFLCSIIVTKEIDIKQHNVESDEPVQSAIGNHVYHLPYLRYYALKFQFRKINFYWRIGYQKGGICDIRKHRWLLRNQALVLGSANRFH